MAAPQLDPEEIARQLNAMNRQPFRDLLARFLRCAPSDEAIERLAERNPDRYAQALAIVGRLGGFNEKLELEGTLTHNLSQLSDAELLARMASLQGQLDMQSNVPTDKPA